MELPVNRNVSDHHESQTFTIPWATYAIIGTNVLIHLIVTRNTHLVIPSEISRAFGFVPSLFGDLSTSHTLVTCMFLHGDLIHLSGNMVFLLVFGQRVESDFGAINFLAFYMTAGVTACLAHAIVESESTKPLIGASGAISGVLGAFLIANPRARITLVLDPTLIYCLAPAYSPASRVVFLAWVVSAAAWLGTETSSIKYCFLGSRRRIFRRNGLGNCDFPLLFQREIRIFLIETSKIGKPNPVFFTFLDPVAFFHLIES